MIKNERVSFKHIFIDFKRIILTLHRNFNTAHSSSATRVNFFVRVGSKTQEIDTKIYGYGQCGLPPKKPGCYMSNIDDCFQFMEKVRERLEKDNKSMGLSQQISNIPQYLSKKLTEMKSQLKTEITQVIKILEEFNQIEHFRAPKCALEFALLDLLTKTHKITVTQFLFGQVPKEHKSYSFYTASLQENSQMIQNARDHLKITEHIKFKYNNNIKQLIQLLKIVNKEQIGKKIIIDANCSWKVADFQFFIEALKDKQFQDSNFVQNLLYIQQPFDLDINNFQQWKVLKNKSPVQILADESFRNEKDIIKIKQVAHAVNIKTQKTGGVFATLRAALQAQDQGLEVMFGSMCSTQLGCTQTFQFFPLAKYMDIDGALLVKQPQLQGGFYWSEKGEVKPFQNRSGLRIEANKFFADEQE